jgi:molecular chaperone HscB
MPAETHALPLHNCKHCGAGAGVDLHFCPQCEKILTLGRHGDYFRFFGLPRKLQIDPKDLEQRFRALSRQFHPDYFYNATSTERLASLERTSYLNDAFRALRDPVARVEYLLALEGVTLGREEEGGGQVPPGLLEEVFALNEQVEAVRERRQAAADAGEIAQRVEEARQPIERKRLEHARLLDELFGKWDSQQDGGAPPSDRRAILDALRTVLLERRYLNNLSGLLDSAASG